MSAHETGEGSKTLIGGQGVSVNHMPCLSLAGVRSDVSVARPRRERDAHGTDSHVWHAFQA